MTENINIELLEEGTYHEVKLPGYWGECVVYVIKENETLEEIAKPNKTTVRTLKLMNGIEDENADLSGKKIFIPYQ